MTAAAPLWALAVLPHSKGSLHSTDGLNRKRVTFTSPPSPFQTSASHRRTRERGSSFTFLKGRAVWPLGRVILVCVAASLHPRPAGAAGAQQGLCRACPSRGRGCTTGLRMQWAHMACILAGRGLPRPGLSMATAPFFFVWSLAPWLQRLHHL